MSYGWPLISDSSRWYNYAGHHRSVSHYISGHLLRCNLRSDHEDPEDAEKEFFFPISDISFYNVPNKRSLRKLSLKFGIFDDEALNIFVRYCENSGYMPSKRRYEFLDKLRFDNSVRCRWDDVKS